jgi:hypothetical protein
MIIFTNPGLIELEAVTTMGVSVKQEGSFGRFGTGLKFAIATILRGGGSITLYRGLERYAFGSRKSLISGKEFDIVTIAAMEAEGNLNTDVPISLGVTTQLGRDWEPWMVLRELGCNALDEHGEFFQPGADKETGRVTSGGHVEDGHTTFIVEWDQLDSAYKQRDELFLKGAILWESEKLRILTGPSAHLFYRGIRVYKLEKPALFTYDILAEQNLTEDRTLSSSYYADRILRDSWLTMEDKQLLGQALAADTNYYEHKIDFQDASWGLKPSKAFIAVAADLRDQRKLRNAAATKIVAKAMRSKSEEMSTYGSYRRAVEDGFSYAIEQLQDLGVNFTEDHPFVVVDELEDEELSMVEDGRIYLLRGLTTRPAREIMEELLRRWVDVNGGAFNAVNLFIPIVLGKSKDLKEDELLLKEDSAIEKEAAAAEKTAAESEVSN